ncbi:hypothetical protein [Candidatus Chromulinivorax destructor]|uniref:DUF3106 domain-containing protein n=1 Tax=Candidatus Chromulinivorax destructor TaxID=2066483 RepID=A0A345ZBF4_9BACT|nr:hypothetical protein [Candidatus Chromulinivorax destructor]AXK60621.1 hypothetical protein C0J27_02590 [Candidatus Chromulinivorax destructor]
MKKLYAATLSMLFISCATVQTGESDVPAKSMSPQAAKFASMDKQEKKAMMQKMSPDERAAFKSQLTPEQQKKLTEQQQKQKQMPRRMARRQARRSGNQG